MHAVIHEAALHMRFVGAEVMRGQLLRLIELARLPNVTVQIYPFTSRTHPALASSFVHVVPAVPELSTVVLEHFGSFQYLGDRESLAQYGTLFENLTEYALPPVDVSLAPEAHSVKDSLALIQHLLYTL